MYDQLVTPNLDPIIKSDGKVILNWVGWCMGYVASAYGIWGGSSAHNGWLAAQYKHQDRDFPAGVFVPVWFDYYTTSLKPYTDIGGNWTNNWGHVVIYKDGVFWSSPLSNKSSADTFTSLAKIESKYGVKFIGWSEDINGTKVTQGEDMGVIAQLQQQVIDMQAQIDTMRPDLVDSHNQIDGLSKELVAERAGYEATIAELRQQLADAGKVTTAAIGKAQVSAPAGTKATWFQKLVAALTKKG